MTNKEVVNTTTLATDEFKRFEEFEHRKGNDNLSLPFRRERVTLQLQIRLSIFLCVISACAWDAFLCEAINLRVIDEITISYYQF